MRSLRGKVFIFTFNEEFLKIVPSGWIFLVPLDLRNEIFKHQAKIKQRFGVEMMDNLKFVTARNFHFPRQRRETELLEYSTFLGNETT